MAVASVEAEFEQARGESGFSVDWTLLKPLIDDVAGQPESNIDMERPLTFAQAYDQYLADPTHTWTSSTREAYRTTRNMMVSIIGANLPIKGLSRAHARDVIETLRWMPRNASKLFPKLTPTQASKHARQNEGKVELISASNANAYIGNFSTFMNWAVNEEMADRNPARGLRIPDPVAKRDKRHPFSKDQLQSIFAAPLYTGCVDGDRGYAKPGTMRPRGARFWVPIIALHTGMRLNEICQLDVADIRQIEDVQCFVISAASISGSNDKRLKTGVSERVIPLHDILLELGLVNYAARLKTQGEHKLFYDITLGSNIERSVAFSKWFTQFLRQSGAHKARTSFHSFRHNFRDELRTARIDQDIAMALGGWTGSMSSSTMASESYGRGFRVELLKTAIDELQFADVELSHLRR